MKSKIVRGIILLGLMSCSILVNADIKCDSGKPGDTVNCSVNAANEYSGTTARIKADAGAKFESCDVCNGDNYSIAANATANFKFKIDSEITESKTINVSFAGETGIIKVEVEAEEEQEEDVPEEITYTVTLIPGNGAANSTKSCTVNSLNTTCSVTLDNLDDENFTGWGKEKNCTQGSKGNIKVKKDTTYYACYKKNETPEDDNEENAQGENQASNQEQSDKNLNSNLLLKSLVVKNGDEEIDIGFSMRINEYNVKVPTSVESLTVDAIAQNEDIVVEVQGQDKLDKEENQILVTLKAEDGTTNEYKIIVKKSDEVELPLLSNLIIGGYTIQFNPNNFIYNVTIDKGIKELNIEATPENKDYDVKIEGNGELKDGSRINVVVTDLETDAASTYVVNISQESSNLIIYICVGALLLIILIILLIIVVRKGKKNSSSNGNVSQKTQPQKKGKSVNNKANIPEVKPTIPIAPQSIPNSTSEKKDDIEVLDF